MPRRTIYILIFFLIIFLGIFVYIKYDQSNQKFSVIFLNVGQGDSALIKFGNGEKMLVDCGIDQKVLQALGRNMPFYDRSIDYLLVTHPDSDHYGGCPSVLKRYKIKHVITNGEEKSGDPYWLAWEKYVKNEGVTEQVINQSQELFISDSRLQFLSPDKTLDLSGKPATGNNNSIVFTLTHFKEKFLFMGDAELPLEDGLIKKYCVTRLAEDGESRQASTPVICLALSSDYIKIGHHGSDSSSGELFLEVVNPTKAIISVGKNTFGHPSFRILKKLQRVGAEVLRTDRIGDITLF